MKPNHHEGIVSTKPRLNSVYDFLGLLYCFIVLWCVLLSPGPTWYISYWYDTIQPIY